MEKSEDNLIAWIRAQQGSPSNDVILGIDDDIRRGSPFNDVILGIGDDIRQGAPTDGVVVGIGDDMAILRPPPDLSMAVPNFTLVATDMLMDGVHFDSAVHSPEEIGRKSLAVNLSDCAAMAVQPCAALVSVALPQQWSMSQAQGLFRGIQTLADAFQCPLIGGDTNSWSRPLVISVTVLARPWPGVRPVRRDGLRPGDWVGVTGSLGGSIRGHHIQFMPRVQEARVLAETCGASLHAMLDLSDGLSSDAHRMAAACGCAIELDAGMLRRVASKAAREAAQEDGRSILEHVLNDGEDFELLFGLECTYPDRLAEKKELDRMEGEGGRRSPETTHVGSRWALRDEIGCTIIGRAFEGSGVWLHDAASGDPAVSPIAVPRGGWQHFTNP